MNIGILFVATDYSADIADVARSAEEMGFDSLWAPEHTVLPVDTFTRYGDPPIGPVPKYYADMVDPFVALARASAVTTTLKLGTAVCLLPEHNPLLLAKRVATLDMFSKGRFLLGIGSGWNREETEIMGGDFEHRWAQARDSVLAMKQLWTTVESEYRGKYYDFPPVYSFPMPVQRPHPPVLLGGMAKNVFRRVVAWGDGWIPVTGPEEAKAGRETLDALAKEAGRDPSTIEVTAVTQGVDRELVGRYEDARVDRVVCLLPPTEGDKLTEELERVAAETLG